MGRKSKLTPELQDELCKLVAASNSLTDAAMLCDVHVHTVLRWMAEGEQQKSGKYRVFREAIERAKAQRRSAIKLQVRLHGKKDWRALMALGAVTDPEEFVPQLRVHVSSQLGAALDRLKEAFADEPQAYERALHALAGGARDDETGGDPGS